MAQLCATEMVYRVADRAMQVHGGMGFMKELWIERGYRDARMFRLLDAGSEELRTRIARAIGCPTG
jgi:alkylation response protein AidB-like acyl-CoA dehydrogenase